MPALARHQPAHAHPRERSRARGCKTASRKKSSFSRFNPRVRCPLKHTTSREVALFPVASVSGSTIFGYVEGNPLGYTDPEGLQSRSNSSTGSGYGPGGPGANLRWPSMGTNAPAPTYNVNQTSANRGNLSSTNANLMNFFTANSNGIYRTGNDARGGTFFETTTSNGTRLVYRNTSDGGRVDIYTRGGGGRETLHPDGGACLR